MAAVQFDVTPEELNRSAAEVEGKASEFKKAHEDIYMAVQDLRVSYKGEASDTFNQRIEGYRNDFDAADKTLAKYVEFLRKYASDIEKTEAENKAKAAALKVGK